MLSLQKDSLMFLQMFQQCVHIKQKPFKPIQAYLCIFQQILAYSGIILTYLGTYVDLACSEPQYLENQRPIQNPGIFRNLVYSKPQAYSEPCQISEMKHFSKIVNSYNYFADYNYFGNISFSLSPLYEINMIFCNTGLIFT